MYRATDKSIAGWRGTHRGHTTERKMKRAGPHVVHFDECSCGEVHVLRVTTEPGDAPDAK